MWDCGMVVFRVEEMDLWWSLLKLESHFCTLFNSGVPFLTFSLLHGDADTKREHRT